MYKQLDKEDRNTIEIQLKRWAKNKEIAELLWKNPWTISREIDRNSVIKEWTTIRVYLAKEAQVKSDQRCWRKNTQSKKINFNTNLKLFIIEQIQRKDIIPSPKIIAHLWNSNNLNKVKISHTSIYEWLETSRWNQYKKYLQFKYKGYKTRKKEDIKPSKIKDRIDIEQRPVLINERREKWHFEGDLIVSKKWFPWALLTLVDRATRLPIVVKINDKSSNNIMNIIASIKEELGIKSITFDNWMEFAYHYLLNDIWINTYFCKPYHSREKWSIENLNRTIRRFFPKWTIFDDISQEQIKSICDIIANTPREILWFLSPNQVHFS